MSFYGLCSSSIRVIKPAHVMFLLHIWCYKLSNMKQVKKFIGLALEERTVNIVNFQYLNDRIYIRTTCIANCKMKHKNTFGQED